MKVEYTVAKLPRERYTEPKTPLEPFGITNILCLIPS